MSWTPRVSDVLREQCLKCGAERGHYCMENGYAMPIFHEARIDDARTRAGRHRARFVDRDGRSFFDEIGPNNGTWLRYEQIADGRNSEMSIVAKTVAYRRELWHVPIGPIACPLSHIDIEDDERIDVVYRYQSG